VPSYSPIHCLVAEADRAAVEQRPVLVALDQPRTVVVVAAAVETASPASSLVLKAKVADLPTTAHGRL